MTFKQFCLVLGISALFIAALNDGLWFVYRIMFFVHGITFIVAFDAIKDVEKAKRKERELTEIHMKQGWLEGWEKSEAARYTFMITHITNTVDTLLKQLATYVRVGTPDHIERTHHDEPRVRHTTED